MNEIKLRKLSEFVEKTIQPEVAEGLRVISETQLSDLISLTISIKAKTEEDRHARIILLYAMMRECSKREMTHTVTILASVILSFAGELNEIN